MVAVDDVHQFQSSADESCHRSGNRILVRRHALDVNDCCRCAVAQYAAVDADGLACLRGVVGLRLDTHRKIGQPCQLRWKRPNAVGRNKHIVGHGQRRRIVDQHQAIAFKPGHVDVDVKRIGDAIYFDVVDVDVVEKSAAVGDAACLRWRTWLCADGNFVGRGLQELRQFEGAIVGQHPQDGRRIVCVEPKGNRIAFQAQQRAANTALIDGGHVDGPR